MAAGTAGVIAMAPGGPMLDPASWLEPSIWLEAPPWVLAPAGALPVAGLALGLLLGRRRR
jgi:hypothetical protein